MAREFKKFFKKNKKLIWKCVLIVFAVLPFAGYILFTLGQAL